VQLFLHSAHYRDRLTYLTPREISFCIVHSEVCLGLFYSTVPVFASSVESDDEHSAGSRRPAKQIRYTHVGSRNANQKFDGFSTVHHGIE
jgi:hypothetical protein